MSAGVRGGAAKQAALGLAALRLTALGLAALGLALVAARAAPAMAAPPLTRGVRIMNPPVEIPMPEAPPAIATPAPPPPGGPPPRPSSAPIRIAALDGKAANFASLTPLETAFDVVLPNQQPDIVWDPKSRDVTAGGDLIAREIEAGDLPSVIDRMATVRGVKQMMAQAPLNMRLTPDTKIHTRGTKVDLTVDDVQGRAFFLINIAGDGTVQTLYPASADQPVYDKSQFRMQFQAREPFGSDQLVAISTPQALPELEQALKRLNERRASGQVIKLLTRLAPAGMRLGSIALNTAP